MLAKNLRAPRATRCPALSLTTIVGTPPGACSLLQGIADKPAIRSALRPPRCCFGFLFSCPLERPSGGSAQWVNRQGCRFSRAGPRMAQRGDPCRSEHAREKPESTTGCQASRVIVDLHRRNAARSMLAPTGSSK